MSCVVSIQTYAYIEERNRKESRGQTETILTDRDKVQERIRTMHRMRRNDKELNMHPAGALQYAFFT
jgi:hypothetical protein